MKSHVTRFTLTFAAAAMLILFAAAAPAAAATDTLRTLEPISGFVPCANGGLGETVEGVVKLHAVFGTTDDGAGGFHLHAQAQLHGVLIGTITGDRYQFHGDYPFIFADRINENAGGSMNGAFNFGVDVIGTGGAVSFHSTWREQVTYNADGVLTMEKIVMTETCN
jgi:hypothetical protein